MTIFFLVVTIILAVLFIGGLYIQPYFSRKRWEKKQKYNYKNFDAAQAAWKKRKRD